MKPPSIGLIAFLVVLLGASVVLAAQQPSAIASEVTSQYTRVVVLISNSEVIDVSAGGGVDEAQAFISASSGDNPRGIVIATQLCREQVSQLLVACPEVAPGEPADLLVTLRADVNWARYFSFKLWQDSAAATTIARFDHQVVRNYNAKALLLLKGELVALLRSAEGSPDQDSTDAATDVEQQRRIDELRQKIAVAEEIAKKDRLQRSPSTNTDISAIFSSSQKGRHEVAKACGDVLDECWQVAHLTYTSSHKNLVPPLTQHQKVDGVSVIGTTEPQSRDTSQETVADLPANSDAVASARMIARVSEPQGVWMLKLVTDLPHDSYAQVRLGVRVVPQRHTFSMRALMGLTATCLFYLLFGIALICIKVAGLRAKHLAAAAAEAAAVEEQRRNSAEERARRERVVAAAAAATAAAASGDAAEDPAAEAAAAAQNDLFDNESEHAPLARLHHRINAAAAERIAHARRWWQHRRGQAGNSVRSDNDEGDDQLEVREPEQVAASTASAVVAVDATRDDANDSAAERTPLVTAGSAVTVRDEPAATGADSLRKELASRLRAQQLQHQQQQQKSDAETPVATQQSATARPPTPSDSDEETDICRICRCAEPTNELFAPCKCNGSSKFVHRSCLKQWRETTTNPMHRTHCAECKAPYRIEVTFEHPAAILKKSLAALAKRVFAIAALILSIIGGGYFLKVVLWILSFDRVSNIIWDANNAYHWLLGVMLLASLSITITATRFFVVDFPRFSTQFVILLALSTVPVVGFGYVGQFIIWVLNDTLWSAEASFGLGLWVALFSYNYLLPSVENHVDRILIAHADVAERAPEQPRGEADRRNDDTPRHTGGDAA